MLSLLIRNERAKAVATIPPQQQCPLLALPTDLRRHILTYAMDPVEAPIKLSIRHSRVRCTQPPSPTQLSLLLTNHQLHAEAKNLLHYHIRLHNIFQDKVRHPDRRRFNPVDWNFLRSLRHVEFQLSYDETEANGPMSRVIADFEDAMTVLIENQVLETFKFGFVLGLPDAEKRKRILDEFAELKARQMMVQGTLEVEDRLAVAWRMIGRLEEMFCEDLDVGVFGCEWWKRP